jgi:hypothetical protein
MNFKQLVVSTNNVLAYIAFAIVALFAVGVFFTGQPIYAWFTLVGGWIACCLVFGFWFALSSMVDNSNRQVVLAEKQNSLMETQNTLIKKIYIEMQANSDNQFVLDENRD